MACRAGRFGWSCSQLLQVLCFKFSNLDRDELTSVFDQSH